MSGQNHFSEKCVCGAEIALSAAWEFIDTSKIEERFALWQRQHRNCISLFHQVQKERLQNRITKGL